MTLIGVPIGHLHPSSSRQLAFKNFGCYIGYGKQIRTHIYAHTHIGMRNMLTYLPHIHTHTLSHTHTGTTLLLVMQQVH